MEAVLTDRVMRDMVFVEGGEFDMGATIEQFPGARADELPVNRTKVRNFYISKYEVTQSLWEYICGSKSRSHFVGAPDLPVECVANLDCKELIDSLRNRSGLDFRLPSEAEWEYAARGGRKSLGYRYAGSDNIEEVAWFGDNGEGKTHPVGRKKPNELGLYDMSGNVIEICGGGNRIYTYSYSHLWERTSDEMRTIMHNLRRSAIPMRGGGWNGDECDCRVSARFIWGKMASGKKSCQLDFIGFRLALSADENGNPLRIHTNV